MQASDVPSPSAAAGETPSVAQPAAAITSDSAAAKDDEQANPAGRSSRQMKRKGVFGHTMDFVGELLKILMIVLLLRAYVVQASSVEGHSMDATLHDGDLLLVERFTLSLINSPPWFQAVFPDSWLPSVERGDIVVLTSPENGNNELVKRVIAVAGDYIFFHEDEGLVYLNGQILEEPYLAQDVLKELGTNSSGHNRHFHSEDVRRMNQAYLLDSGEVERAIARGELATTGVKVPAGCIFVMGDNRGSGRSNDSRAWAGTDIGRGAPGMDHLWVTVKNVHGRVLARLRMPWDYDAENPVFPQ